VTEYGPEIRLMDAMATDLAENAGLPDCNVVKYRRPRVILPEDCPLLLVVVDDAGKLEAPEGTIRVRSRVPFSLEWYEQAVDEVQTLVDDPELSLALWLNAKRIELRVRKWAVEMTELGGVPLGVPECEEIDAAALLPFRLDLEDGAVEGIAVIAEARIVEDAVAEIG
jgi:hypothetical protein